MKAEHELLKKMLLDAAEILNAGDRDYWLEAGTLLGFVRDNSFIEWEHDVDLGMWKQEKDLAYQMKLAGAFRKYGYETCLSDGHLHIGLKEHRGEIEMAINFYERKDDMAVKPTFVPRNFFAMVCRKFMLSLYDINVLKFGDSKFKRLCGIVINLLPALLFYVLPISLKEIILPRIARIQNTSLFVNKSWVVPIRFFDKLKDIEIFGHDLPGPLDSEGYLEFRYGTDWREPNKQWDTLTQDKSLLGNR